MASEKQPTRWQILKHLWRKSWHLDWDQVGTEKDLSHLDTSLKEQFAERHIPEKVLDIRESNLGYFFIFDL